MWISAVILAGIVLFPTDEPVGPQDGCLHPPFHGITPTNALGDVVGHEDPHDWGCLGDRGPHRGGPGHRAIGLEDVPVPPPSNLCLFPAAPNPVAFATQLGFALPADDHLKLVVYGQSLRHGRPEAFVVRTLMDASLHTGQYTVIWDLKDDQGARVAPGIYRVVLTATGGTLCGDVEVQ
jgi:hypothetical protein